MINFHQQLALNRWMMGFFRGGTLHALENRRLHVLIGSRKFTEGWSSWRVSTMGLLNMGQGRRFANHSVIRTRRALEGQRVFAQTQHAWATTQRNTSGATGNAEHTTKIGTTTERFFRKNSYPVDIINRRMICQ